MNSSSRIDDDDDEQGVQYTFTPSTYTSTTSTSVPSVQVEEEEEKFDSIVTSILSKFKSRASFGKKKYGTDLDRTDLNVFEWINHAQEEHMDAILYLEKLGVELKKQNMTYTPSPEQNAPHSRISINPLLGFMSSLMGVNNRQPQPQQSNINHPSQLLDMVQAMMKNDTYDESYSSDHILDEYNDNNMTVTITDLDVPVEINSEQP